MSKPEPQPSQPPKNQPPKVVLQSVKAQVLAASPKPDKNVAVPKYSIENFSGGTKEDGK